MRSGVRLGIDVGRARIGVARSDAAGGLVVPLSTVRRDGRDVARIAQLAQEYAAVELVVGLPRNMDGTEGASARDARQYAGRLARRTDLPVRLVDERLSTVTAHQALHAAGLKERAHRPVVDQVAASVILEQALATEKNTGLPAGELWEGNA